MKRRGLSAVIGVLVALFASQAASGVNVLLLTDNSGSLTTVESNLKTNLQSAGYTVNTLWDGDSQANYTAAFANNDVVYIPSDVSTTDMGNKLRTCPIGIVNEIVAYMDDLGLCSSNGTTTTSSAISIATNSHYITSPIFHGVPSRWARQLTRFRRRPVRQHLVQQSWQPSAASIRSSRSTPVATLANTISSNSTASGRRIQMPLQCGVISHRHIVGERPNLAPANRAVGRSLRRQTRSQWKLNETSGTSASDSSGNSRTGTVTGSSSWVAAVLNNGFSFDGATKIQATGLMGNPRNVSVAAWAKLTTADSSAPK